MDFVMRVGGRVVECSGLENQRARKRSGGSNPSPPARGLRVYYGYHVLGSAAPNRLSSLNRLLVTL